LRSKLVQSLLRLDGLADFADRLGASAIGQDQDSLRVTVKRHSQIAGPGIRYRQQLTAKLVDAGLVCCCIPGQSRNVRGGLSILHGREECRERQRRGHFKQPM
jgi:hypothetical protein